MNDWLAVQNTLFEMRYVDMLSVIMRAAGTAFVFILFFCIALELIAQRFKNKTPLLVVPLLFLLLFVAKTIPDLSPIVGLPIADATNNGFIRYSLDFRASTGFIFVPLCLGIGILFFTLFHIKRENAVDSIGGSLVRLMIVVLGGIAGGCVAALLL